MLILSLQIYLCNIITQIYLSWYWYAYIFHFLISNICVLFSSGFIQKYHVFNFDFAIRSLPFNWHTITKITKFYWLGALLLPYYLPFLFQLVPIFLSFSFNSWCIFRLHHALPYFPIEFGLFPLYCPPPPISLVITNFQNFIVWI